METENLKKSSILRDRIVDNTVFSLENWREKFILTAFIFLIMMASYNFYRGLTINKEILELEKTVSILTYTMKPLWMP